MLNSKLYAILQNFETTEQKRCRKFISSPYFNSHELLVKLYDLLIKHIRSTRRQKELSREALWTALYGNARPFDDALMRKYLSNLHKLVERYLKEQIYEKAALLQEAHLIEALAEHKLNKAVQTTLRRAQKNGKNGSEESPQKDLFRYLIHKNYYHAIEHIPKEAAKVDFGQMSSYLDAFYIEEKLNIYCAILSRKYLGTDESQIYLLEGITRHLQEHIDQYKAFPIVQIYYQIYLALTESENTQHYYHLKTLLEKNHAKLPQNKAFELYGYAINYCVRKINQGDSLFLREYFELHKVLLDKGLLFADGVLPLAQYRNLVLVGLRLGELKWTENFIHDYKKYLPVNSRENAFSFNLALLYFYKKEYEQVIKLLRYVEYEDITFNLNAKVLLLQTYYEMDEIDPLESLMDSFRAYLQRHKEIAPRRRQTFRNFIRFVKKLTRIIPRNKEQIEAFKNELAQTKQIVNRPWLLEKAEELRR